jgi:uncharacterized protein YukE
MRVYNEGTAGPAWHRPGFQTAAGCKGLRATGLIMAKASVDPAELRRFARELTRFNSDLEALMAGLQNRLKELERSWTDQEQKRFTQEFELTVKTLRRFLDASTQHAMFLAKKAGHIDDYLQQR